MNIKAQQNEQLAQTKNTHNQFSKDRRQDGYIMDKEQPVGHLLQNKQYNLTQSIVLAGITLSYIPKKLLT